MVTTVKVRKQVQYNIRTHTVTWVNHFSTVPFKTLHGGREKKKLKCVVLFFEEVIPQQYKSLYQIQETSIQKKKLTTPPFTCTVCTRDTQGFIKCHVCKYMGGVEHKMSSSCVL